MVPKEDWAQELVTMLAVLREHEKSQAKAGPMDDVQRQAADEVAYLTLTLTLALTLTLTLTDRMIKLGILRN